MNAQPSPDLVSDIQEATSSVWRTLAGLPWDDTWDLSTPLTNWSVGDIAGHLLHLERDFVLREPDVVSGDLHALTESGVTASRLRDRETVLEELEQISTAGPAAVAATQDWNRIRQTVIGPQPAWVAFELRVGDLYVHLLDLVEAMGIDPEGVRIESAERVLTQRAIRLSGWAASRRARLDDGTLIRLVLTGPGASTVEIAVADGRGTVRAPTQEDTAEVVEGPGIAYVLAAGGRSHPAYLVSQLTITGAKAGILVEKFGLFG